MRRIVTLAIVLAACASLSACGSSSPSSPLAVRASIVAAALAQDSVHLNELATDAVISARWASDVNAHSGKQRLTLKGGTFGGGEAEVLLVNDTLYVRGNPSGLRYTLYMTGPQSRRYARQWISIPKGDRLYAETAAGLTLPSIVHNLTPQGKLKLVRRNSPATRLLAVTGAGRGDAPSVSLSARASGDRLPVAYSEIVAPYGHTRDGSFSKWNEPVSVHAPADATPITIVRGSPNLVRAAIVAAALAQSAVHVSESHGADMYGTEHSTLDVTAQSGVERVAYPVPGSRAELRLVNGTVYVKGTPAALDYYLLDLTTPQAKQYAGKWISFPKGDRLHASLADRLMLASVVKHALPRNHFTSGGKLKLLRRTSHGTPLFVLRWTEEDLFDHVIRARATGTPLPVSFYDSCGFECDSRDTFSKWNEPVKVQAPASSTPIAVVRG